MAYKKDTKDMTALHIAADRGHVKIVNEILKYCPDCSELVDKRGWNALHFAVNSSHKDVVNVILNRSSLSNLLNEKDESGNTPLLHSKSLPYIKDLMRHDRFGDNEIAFPHNRPAEFRKFLGEHYIKPKNFLFGLLQWKEEDYKSRKDRFVSIMKETSETHMIVDTLIATVTFTAGITMPGGFIGQEGPHSGSPVLMRSTAFKAFIITNTIAMVQSCSAAFFQLFMPLLFDEQNLGDFSFLLASLAFFASISAMGTMMMAFVLGTYAVLMHSWDLAVANSVRQEEDRKRFVSIMEKASKTHLVVDTLIATVVFTAGITMPGGFIGHEGPHSGSPVLIRNTAFKAFIITNTIAMVQSCSAAFIHLFMPLLFDEQNVGEFSFLLASLAFCLSISAMGAMVLAFVMGTYAVLMHSLDLAIANSVIGLLFFIPVFFVSIGCLKYLLEILRVGSSWILDKLYDFKDFLGDALDCILDGCFNLYERIVDIFNR
nr:ankyrin repeat-containing protein itn1 [Quercus suber]